MANKLLGEGPYKQAGPIPVHKFDLKNWWSLRLGGPGMGIIRFNPKYAGCNTAACAVGWAMSDPWFQVRNLQIGFEEAAGFFGITLQESKRLFSSEAYRLSMLKSARPVTVAKRIRKVLAKYEAEAA